MERNSFLIVSKETVADNRISATTKLLFAQLLDHRNKRTGQCNPRQTKLAEELGISVDTVQRHLSKLCQHGLITAIRGQNGCRYEIPETASCGFPNRKTADGKPQNRGSGAPGPLYEPYIRNHSGFAASLPKKKPFNAPLPPRKSAQSETLEAYYREERRKAGRR